MAQALVKSRTQDKMRPTTMHDGDYTRVFRVIEKARANMLPGQVCEEFRCPLCGGPAFIFHREQNIGKDYVGGCERGCWDLWE